MYTYKKYKYILMAWLEGGNKKTQHMAQGQQRQQRHNYMFTTACVRLTIQLNSWLTESFAAKMRYYKQRQTTDECHIDTSNFSKEQCSAG